MPFGSLTLPEKVLQSNRSSTSAIQSTAASQDINELDIGICEDFSSELQSARSHPYTQPSSPSNLNQTKTETQLNDSLLQVKRKPSFNARNKSPRPPKLIQKVWRLCDEKRSNNDDEPFVPGMFERMHYRPENQWII